VILFLLPGWLKLGDEAGVKVVGVRVGMVRVRVGMVRVGVRMRAVEGWVGGVGIGGVIGMVQGEAGPVVLGGGLGVGWVVIVVSVVMWGGVGAGMLVCQGAEGRDALVYHNYLGRNLVCHYSGTGSAAGPWQEEEEKLPPARSRWLDILVYLTFFPPVGMGT
jgi:hypothetical protein